MIYLLKCCNLNEIIILEKSSVISISLDIITIGEG